MLKHSMLFRDAGFYSRVKYLIEQRLSASSGFLIAMIANFVYPIIKVLWKDLNAESGSLVLYWESDKCEWGEHTFEEATFKKLLKKAAAAKARYSVGFFYAHQRSYKFGESEKDKLIERIKGICEIVLGRKIYYRDMILDYLIKPPDKGLIDEIDFPKRIWFAPGRVFEPPYDLPQDNFFYWSVDYNGPSYYEEGLSNVWGELSAGKQEAVEAVKGFCKKIAEFCCNADNFSPTISRYYCDVILDFWQTAPVEICELLASFCQGGFTFNDPQLTSQDVPPSRCLVI